MRRHIYINYLILTAFFTNILGPLPTAYASSGSATLLKPGTQVSFSDKFSPTMITGLKVFPDNPFHFDFVINKGDQQLSSAELTAETNKLVKYFLAALTVPEKDLWVNLSPTEKDRIVPDAFGVTEMGRDLLAEDYLLKQISASLTNPETDLGKSYWDSVKNDVDSQAQNKVWIVPQEATVYENTKNGVAYIISSHLKVMMQEDYEQMKDSQRVASTSNAFRSTILPKIEKEVNEGKNFAQLRQIYNSYILATWYKKKIKNSILNQVYTDQNKIAGINIDDPQEKQRIYEQYLEAFKKGAYNYIKEEYDQNSQEMIPRKYFSGGVELAWASSAAISITVNQTAIPPTVPSLLVAGINISPDKITQGTFSPDLAGITPGNLSEQPQFERSILTVAIPSLEEILLTAQELQLTVNQAHELLLYFKNQVPRINETINYKSATKSWVVIAVEPDIERRGTEEYKGIAFYARTLNPDGSVQSEIGRLKVSRKDKDTLLLFGLYSRDFSQPDEEVVVIVPYINFDYTLKETQEGFDDFIKTLGKKLSPQYIKYLESENLDKPEYRALLKEFYDDEIYTAAKKLEETEGISFNDALNRQLGGEVYKEYSPVVKFLARAAVGLTRKQIAEAKFEEEGLPSLAAIAIAFDSIERKYSPSQKYPINTAIVDSLTKSARALRDYAQHWGMKLEMDVAMPDGLQNYFLYVHPRLFGFKLVMPDSIYDRSDDDRFVMQIVEDFEKLRSEGQKDPIAGAWKILRKYKFRHTLARMIYDPQDPNQEVDLQQESAINALNTLFEKYIPELQPAFPGQNLEVRTSANLDDGGVTVSIVIPKPLGRGENEVLSLKLASSRQTLQVSGLSIQDPFADPRARVVLTSDDINFASDSQSVKQALDEFTQILRSDLSGTGLVSLFQVDLADPEYVPILESALGKDQFSKLWDEFRNSEKRVPGLIFNNFLGTTLTQTRTNTSQINIVLKILAIAGKGLTKKQLDGLISASSKDFQGIYLALKSAKRNVYPSQRNPTPPELEYVAEKIAKALPFFAKEQNFLLINYQTTGEGALRDLLTYLRSGYEPVMLNNNALVAMVAEEMTTTPGLIASETPAQVAWDLYDGHPEISLALPQQVALIQDLRQVTSPDVPQMRNETEGQADAQASSAVGGIDFNSDQFMLFTQNSDGEIDFSFDPQFVKSLSSASGFSPTIAGIQPLPNLKDFLNTPFAITP